MLLYDRSFDYYYEAEIFGRLEFPAAVNFVIADIGTIAQLFVVFLLDKIQRSNINTYETNSHVLTHARMMQSTGTLFGTQLGSKVRQWCARWGWPLVWSPGVYAHPTPAHWPPSNFTGRRRVVDPGSLRHTHAGRNMSAAAIDAGKAVFERWWSAANSSRSAAGGGEPTTETVSMWWEGLSGEQLLLSGHSSSIFNCVCSAHLLFIVVAAVCVVKQRLISVKPLTCVKNTCHFITRRR